MNNIIEINNLTLPYCFSNFNIKFLKNKFNIIAGPNSSGKTTLLRTILGQIFTEDMITIFGQEINYYRITEINMLIKYIFPDEFQFNEENIYDELFYSLQNQNINNKSKNKKIKELISIFEFNKIKDQTIENLKTYEKINLELAKILLQNPKILLLDNIFKNYSKEETKKVIKILREYQKKYDLTIILATNNLSDALNCDYLYIIKENKIILEGNPKEILKNDTILNRIGLELPFMIDLSIKLKDYDLIKNIDYDLDIEGLVNHLWK